MNLGSQVDHLGLLLGSRLQCFFNIVCLSLSNRALQELRWRFSLKTRDNNGLHAEPRVARVSMFSEFAAAR